MRHRYRELAAANESGVEKVVGGQAGEERGGEKEKDVRRLYEGQRVEACAATGKSNTSTSWLDTTSLG
jgi:hypothetical protein